MTLAVEHVTWLGHTTVKEVCLPSASVFFKQSKAISSLIAATTTSWSARDLNIFRAKDVKSFVREDMRTRGAVSMGCKCQCTDQDTDIVHGGETGDILYVAFSKRRSVAQARNKKPRVLY
jgi:hypothetical protein